MTCLTVAALLGWTVWRYLWTGAVVLLAVTPSDMGAIYRFPITIYR